MGSHDPIIYIFENMKRKIVAIIFFIVGLLLILTPIILNWYNSEQYKKQIDEWQQNIQQEDYSDIWAEADKYNQSLLEKRHQFLVSDDEKQYIWTLLNPFKTGMMGYVSIPKIDVCLPIYQGTEEKYLQSGAGMMLGSSLPTGGISTHTIITAHNGLAKAKMFTDIDQLDIGDQFNLTILDRVLTYKVEKIQIVEPENFEPLLIQENRSLVTLYTCTPYGVNTHRLLVTGSLASEKTLVKGR